jgi:hypothetical protein
LFVLFNQIVCLSSIYASDYPFDICKLLLESSQKNGIYKTAGIYSIVIAYKQFQRTMGKICRLEQKDIIIQ